MRTRALTLTIFILSIAAMSAVAANELRHNPFRVPVDVSGDSRSGGGSSPAGTRPTLIGILLGNDEPLVNLDGKVIGVGEEAGGYLLVEVGQEHAVFRRGDETITMSLYPGDDDE